MDNLINHINKRIRVDKRKKDIIINAYERVELNKHKHLLSIRDICRYIFYVNKGCLRVYAIDENGFERNVFFALEDWWVVDLKSFIEQSPARFSIEALEECELYRISKSNFDKLLEEVPELEKWFRLLIQKALISSENRINEQSSLKAEARYVKFLEKYPKLESRISQRQVASYLGISPEFLSTLKAKRWKNRKS